MEALDYSQIIRTILSEFAQGYNKRYPNSFRLLFDDERHQYQVLRIGWQGNQRLYNIPLHLSLENGKIYVEQNNTDRQIAAELMEYGVPASDIVLAFHPPSVRHLTDYAVG
jgi:hypothetical protein